MTSMATPYKKCQNFILVLSLAAVVSNQFTETSGFQIQQPIEKNGIAVDDVDPTFQDLQNRKHFVSYHPVVVNHPEEKSGPITSDTYSDDSSSQSVEDYTDVFWKNDSDEEEHVYNSNESNEGKGVK